MPIVTKKSVMEWDEEKIAVKLKRDGVALFTDMEGMMFGTLAIHPSIGSLKWNGGEYAKGDGSEWDLRHVPTQQTVSRFKELDDAVKVAEFMWSKLGKDILDSDLAYDQIKERFPKWLFPWVKAVREAKTWVDPKPFMEGSK